MLKIMGIITLAAMVVIARPAVGQVGTEESFSRQLVAQWEVEREEHLHATLSAWLRGEPEAIWLASLTKMANVCMNIAITDGREDPALKVVARHDCPPAALLAWYLDGRGHVLDAEEAFVGRIFRVAIPGGHFEHEPLGGITASARSESLTERGN